MTNANNNSKEFLVCRESFSGDFGNNELFTGQRGKTIIDPSSAEGKRVLRNWSKYFEPLAPNYPYQVTPERAVAPAMAGSATATPGEERVD